MYLSGKGKEVINMQEKHLDELLYTIRYNGTKRLKIDEVEQAIEEIKKEILK